MSERSDSIWRVSKLASLSTLLTILMLFVCERGLTYQWARVMTVVLAWQHPAAEASDGGQLMLGHAAVFTSATVAMCTMCTMISTWWAAWVVAHASDCHWPLIDGADNTAAPSFPAFLTFHSFSSSYLTSASFPSFSSSLHLSLLIFLCPSHTYLQPFKFITYMFTNCVAFQ